MSEVVSIPAKLLHFNPVTKSNFWPCVSGAAATLPAAPFRCVMCGELLPAKPLRMRWLPPTCFPPAPQLSRRGHRVIRSCENRVIPGPNSKKAGPRSPTPAGSTVCGFDTLQDSRILKAGVQNHYLHVGVAAPPLCLLYFVSLHRLTEGRSGHGFPLLTRHQLSTLHRTNARALLPIAALELLQLVVYPFRTPRTSYEIGRPAITLQRSD